MGKRIAVKETVKTNVLGFRDIFSYDIQRCVSNDEAHDNISGKKYL
jgi:hypothetical protein